MGSDDPSKKIQSRKSKYVFQDKSWNNVRNLHAQIDSNYIKKIIEISTIIKLMEQP